MENLETSKNMNAFENNSKTEKLQKSKNITYDEKLQKSKNTTYDEKLQKSKNTTYDEIFDNNDLKVNENLKTNFENITKKEIENDNEKLLNDELIMLLTANSITNSEDPSALKIRIPRKLLKASIDKLEKDENEESDFDTDDEENYKKFLKSSVTPNKNPSQRSLKLLNLSVQILKERRPAVQMIQ